MTSAKGGSGFAGESSKTPKDMPTFVNRIVSYFRESKEELEKVTWPSRKDTLRYSILVIATAVIMGAFFAGTDWALNLGLKHLIGLTS